MSVRARAQAAAASAAEAGDDGDDGELAAGPPDAAGRLLGRLSVLPALLAVAWLLAGLPLLLAGVFKPAAELSLAIPLGIVAVWLGLRWTPGRWQAAWPVREPRQARTPWWAVIGVVVIAVAFGVDQFIYHSQFIIVTRDPGSYFQYANWIAHHGSLPIPQDAAAFGGRTHGLTFQSFAYYQVGSNIVPQFMSGLPMVLSAAFWASGVNAAAAVSPLLGACGVLAFGGLTARLAGPRWAPLAALVLALSMPEQFTSRSDYSEPLTQILFLGGICLVLDALNSDGVGARVIAALSGLALGLTLLVRIDGAADVLPLVPYCGLLLLSRRRQAWPLIGGLIVGGGYGVVDGALLSRPYLASIKAALIPLLALTAVLVVATLIVLALRWNKGVPKLRRMWLPNAAAALTVLIAVGFALRPYFQTVRMKSSTSFQDTMAFYERANHLPVDPTRIFYEFSMHWVFWYIGLPAVALATAGAAMLVRRCLLGRSPNWVLPLVLFAWPILTVLYQPSITPDQPWASRRLVPAVLPGFILFAVWGLSWLIGYLRRMDIPRMVYAGVATVLVVLMVVPAVITTFGLRPHSGGPVGIKVVAEGTALKRTYMGEIPAIEGMCAQIPRDATVVFISESPADRMMEDVRGMCGVPAARVLVPRRATVENVLRGIVQAGRRPVLLATARDRLTRYGGPIKQVMRLRTHIDGGTLTTPPMELWALNINVWMSEPSS
jgi:hypothetical protein